MHPISRAKTGTFGVLWTQYEPLVLEKCMLRKMVKGLLFALLVGASSVSAAVSAPFGDLLNVDGQAIGSEADLGIGKWQLVMFWATDCHICAEMKPVLSAFHDEHKDTDAQVLGIALDGHNQHRAVKQYVNDHNVSFPNFVGEIGLVAMNFELNTQEPLRGTPTYLLFNPAGELLAIDYGMLDVAAIERFIESNTLSQYQEQ